MKLNLAEAQLRQMQEDLISQRRARRPDRGPRRDVPLNIQNLLEEDRASRSGGARVLGEEMRRSQTDPLGYGGYSLAAAMRQFADPYGPGGRATQAPMVPAPASPLQQAHALRQFEQAYGDPNALPEYGAPPQYKKGSLPDAKVLGSYQSGTIENIIRQVEAGDVEKAQKMVWDYLDEARAGKRGAVARRISALRKYLPMDEYGKITSKGGKLIDRGFSKWAKAERAAGRSPFMGASFLLDPLVNLIASQPEGAELLRGIGMESVPKPMYKKGSLPGTVPKTGTYKLHKGEIVVSEPQVDEPLLHYLIGDKLRKGITKGNPKGKSGYQDGSLSSDIIGEMPSVTEDENPWQTDPATWARFVEALGRLPEIGGALLGRGAGEAGRLIGGAGEAISEAGKEFERGYRAGAGLPPDVGAEEAAATAGAALPPTPEAMPPREPVSLAPVQGQMERGAEKRYRADLAAATDQIAEWKEGGRKGPLSLTLRGQGRKPLVRGDEDLPPEQRRYAPESPRWRQAQYTKAVAALNRVKADRLFDYLSQAGLRMSPEQRRALGDQAKFLYGLAEQAEQRLEKGVQAAAKQKSRLEEAWLDFRKAQIEARTNQQEAAQDKMDQARERLEDSYADLLEKTLESEDPTQQKIWARELARVKGKLEGVDPNEYYEYLLDELGIGGIFG